MSDVNALLAGIVGDPRDGLRSLLLADALDDSDQTDRAELLRLHRKLIDTCCEPESHPDRAEWQRRVVELLASGVTPCVPRHTLELAGDAPLVGHFVPPGSFLMGGTESDAETPVHRVALTTGFYLGVTPVTQGQWVAVTGENPSGFRGDALPVENVSWNDAMAFCAAATERTGARVRLPTEAEWEYACRAGTTTQYHWGDVSDAKRMNANGTHAWTGPKKKKYRQTTTTAGTFAPNPWGLFDTHGNVLEWCADRYDAHYYVRSPQTDPVCAGGADALRVLRGGSWNLHPHACRAASRDRNGPACRAPFFGFRVAFCLD